MAQYDSGAAELIALDETLGLLGNRIGISIGELDSDNGLVELDIDGTNSFGASRTLTLSPGGSFDFTRCNTDITLSIEDVGTSSVKARIEAKPI